jgi:hypothetical protein
MASTPLLPGPENRTVIIGRTGTGKTVAGLWHLSNQDLERPWVVLNFKNDEHIDSLPYAQDVGFDFIPGKKDKGIFVLRPLPTDMKGNPSPLEKYLWQIWDRENCGVFCDEGFMVGSNDAFDALLTQGRSKRCPMIICTQRPVWLSRYCFSEASFIQCFDLNDQRDIDTIESFMPLEWDEEKPLGPHESFYYEISRNLLVRFKPCPPMKETREVFRQKLERRWVRI